MVSFITVKIAIQSMARRQLANFSIQDIAWVGVRVEALLQAVKTNEPHLVPTKTVRLFITSEQTIPVDDFTLAQSLYDSKHPGMMLLKGYRVPVPVLESYIVCSTLGDDSPPTDWLESALLYVASAVEVDMYMKDEWSKLLLSKIKELGPLAEKGEKFNGGRKPGADGPLVNAIKRHLRRFPLATNAEIWTVFTNRPPRGMAFFDNRIGKYIEYSSGAPDTRYRAFMNAATRARQRLKGGS